ncbi:MAG: gluconokinase [Ferruginibacter sp.]|nr:gluconokinase [Ferruginibacter sp.]
MDYYIGIDIGTTSTKAVAFSATGRALAQQLIAYPLLHPQQNRSEQHPDKILEAVIDCLSTIAAQLPGYNPVLISFSAAMHSLLLMDEKNNPLTNCIIWADNRASELAVQLKQTPAGKNFYHTTGVPIHAMSPFCKVCWFNENEPALFGRVAKFIGIKEFIFYRLFEKYIVDTAIASATGLLNIRLLQWEENILAFAGIDTKQLSAIVPVTHTEMLRPNMQKNLLARLAAFKQTVFVIGSSDGALANLGSGATVQGSMAVTIGTSSAVRVVTKLPQTDREMRTFCYHLAGEQYITGGASNNGAIVLQWLKENVLQNNNSYDAFISMAEAIAPGSDGLLLLPYILGERAPLWNSHARGVYWGLSIEHTHAHIIRATLEAIVYNTYNIGKILMEKTTVDTIYANGGFADNKFWVQLLADMFNLPVIVPAMEETSAFGAVMIALQALKIPPAFEIEAGKKYYPNAANHKIYVRQCNKMQRLYELVKVEF